MSLAAARASCATHCPRALCCCCGCCCCWLALLARLLAGTAASQQELCRTPHILTRSPSLMVVALSDAGEKWPTMLQGKARQGSSAASANQQGACHQ